MGMLGKNPILPSLWMVGRVWLIVSVLKTEVDNTTVSSNLTPSSTFGSVVHKAPGLTEPI